MSVNLSNLPAINFAPVESSAVEAEIISAYEKRTGKTLYPGDPVRIFLESVAWFGTIENNLIDLAAKQNLLAYASGANLDHLGALMGVARIPAQPAKCVIRFTSGQQLNFTIPVPAGTRVATRDGKAMFATALAAQIPAGILYVDIPAYCVETGSVGSGLLPGQIDSLVDPVPYIAKAANIDTSSDGAEVESDEHLRQRIQLAPESYTVAGSAGQYEARTLEVSGEIESVSVTTPEPGVVDVRFVLTGGELPEQAMIDLVYNHLSAETVRPLTDMVLVGAPEPVYFSIVGKWFAKSSDSSILSILNTKVVEAVESYKQWQREKPGRDIVPGKLIELLMTAGVKRVELEEPQFTTVSAIQIAREQQISLVFGGMEEE